MHRMINLATCIIKKIYRLRYDQSVTCLFHSVKFFALTSSQLYSSHSVQIYRKRRNSNKQSHHKDKTKNNKTSTRVLASKQKQKALKCKGVDVLEDDRWNVNSRESTVKIHR